MFFEYFHGDTGSGLGASHQTGWTALVADLIGWREVKEDEWKKEWMKLNAVVYKHTILSLKKFSYYRQTLKIFPFNIRYKPKHTGTIKK